MFVDEDNYGRKRVEAYCSRCCSKSVFDETQWKELFCGCCGRYLGMNPIYEGPKFKLKPTSKK